MLVSALALFSSCGAQPFRPMDLHTFATSHPSNCGIPEGENLQNRSNTLRLEVEKLRNAQAITLQFGFSYQGDTNYRSAIYRISFPELDVMKEGKTKQTESIAVTLTRAQIERIIFQKGALVVVTTIQSPGDWCANLELSDVQIR